jgi:hypothetical protein
MCTPYKLYRTKQGLVLILHLERMQKTPYLENLQPDLEHKHKGQYKKRIAITQASYFRPKLTKYSQLYIKTD